MKHTIILLLIVLYLFHQNSIAQNVGIGTTAPQATLHVKGNQLVGGATHFTTYDSISGKIEWRNSNLYVPVSQYLLQHSAAADGLYYNNSGGISGQLEYRNASGNPVFYTNFINGNGYFKSRLGIATVNPLAGLHVADSSVLFSAAGEVPGTPAAPPMQGAGRRMMWYPDKAALRAGYASGAQWDQGNIGTYSTATGYGTTASQGYATALGFFTVASGIASTAIGNQTIAKAAHSLSIGSLNDASDNPDPFNPNATDRIFQIGNGAGFSPGNAMTVLRNGNVGVSKTNPTEKLDITGNARANNFLYTTPKTFYYSLSGMDFRNERSTDTAGVNLGSGGAYMQNAVAGKRLIAPVHIPQGATMVNMTVYIYDVSASQNLQAVFYRKTIASNFFPNNIGVVASSGSPGVTTAYTTAVNSFDNVVDNSLYTYYIAVNTESASGFWTSNMEIRAVIIEYTQTGAQ